MAPGFLRRWRGGGRTKRPRPRLFLGEAPLVYAIGDVHGQHGLLMRLEATIIADAAAIGTPAALVMVGDYIDRGPDSAAVLKHLLTPPPAGITRHCLCGNHEAAMLDFLADPHEDNWIAIGGMETLRSYGLEPEEIGSLLRGGDPGAALAKIPPAHLGFIESLPVLVETDSAIFVHAGLRPGVPLAEQRDEDLIWIRDGYRGDYAEFGRTVVHGHTPIETPLVAAHRIGIDTGAFYSGRLTAVRLMAGAPPKLFST